MSTADPTTADPVTGKAVTGKAVTGKPAAAAPTVPDPAPAAGPPAPAAAASPDGGAAAEPLLRVDSLAVAFGRRGGRSGQRVLEGVSLRAGAGEILGVIGETGSGKTTLARAVVGLSPVVAGSIAVDGREVTGLRGRALRDFRRTGVAQYLFQDPLRSLDPDMAVRDLVAEPLAVTGAGSREERYARAAEALRRVGLDEALAGRLPGRLSGGQRQRVAVARALVTRPRLLLADEPVSALDASNRNHVLRLFDRLRTELDMAVVLISHDLSSLAGIADRIAVLYRGRLVEQGPTADVLARPLHPYTALLTASAPSVRREHGLDPARLRRGDPPAWADPARSAHPAGCVFAARCPFADDDCRTEPVARERPVAAEAGAGGAQAATIAAGASREVACHHADSWRAEVAPPAAVSA
jgi:oligopeptide/dipeptide ABC transporter ATP-binding protein